LPFDRIFPRIIMIKSLLAAFFLCTVSLSQAMSLGSRHAIVIDESSGQVLIEKNATDIVPIASLTKLMTAMVVLDANLDMNEIIAIEDADVDMLKHSSSRVPVGVQLPRRTLLELALMSSDNRAAAALARTFPGGLPGFQAAVREKAAALDMRRTYIDEPTGLSPYNTSTAADLAKLALAASGYPEIAEITTQTGELVDINGRLVEYRNTNRLVGRKDWTILLSKTGFTNEAGRCIIMRVQAAGRNAIMVLLNARESATRTVDAMNLNRLLSGEAISETPNFAARSSTRGGVMLVKNGKAGNKKKKRKLTCLFLLPMSLAAIHQFHLAAPLH